jgi:hypothetical protein
LSSQAVCERLSCLILTIRWDVLNLKLCCRGAIVNRSGDTFAYRFQRCSVRRNEILSTPDCCWQTRFPAGLIATSTIEWALIASLTAILVCMY